jgi:hypothetical protein
VDNGVYRGLFDGDPVPQTLLRLLGKGFHRRLGNHSPFATSQQGLGLGHHRKNFDPPALALLPQGERFLNRFFFAAESAGFDRLLHEGPLVRRQLDVHTAIVGRRH